jgi:hypothetical protein
VHPPAVAIPRFIQTMEPLPPLSLMVQSQLGGTQLVEAQVHLPTLAIPKFSLELPQAVIEPSYLRAAKAELVE